MNLSTSTSHVAKFNPTTLERLCATCLGQRHRTHPDGRIEPCPTCGGSGRREGEGLH